MKPLGTVIALAVIVVGGPAVTFWAANTLAGTDVAFSLRTVAAFWALVVVWSVVRAIVAGAAADRGTKRKPAPFWEQYRMHPEEYDA